MKKTSQYLTVAEVAKILGFSNPRTKAWLQRAGAYLVRGGVGCTSKVKLKECFPEIYQEILECAYEPEADDFK